MHQIVDIFSAARRARDETSNGLVVPIVELTEGSDLAIRQASLMISGSDTSATSAVIDGPSRGGCS